MSGREKAEQAGKQAEQASIDAATFDAYALPMPACAPVMMGRSGLKLLGCSWMVTDGTELTTCNQDMCIGHTAHSSRPMVSKSCHDERNWAHHYHLVHSAYIHLQPHPASLTSQALSLSAQQYKPSTAQQAA